MYLLGIYLVQLFADLHKVYANQYLHLIDCDKLLICESYAVAQNTADLLADIDNISNQQPCCWLVFEHNLGNWNEWVDSQT